MDKARLDATDMGHQDAHIILAVELAEKLGEGESVRPMVLLRFCERTGAERGERRAKRAGAQRGEASARRCVGVYLGLLTSDGRGA